MGAKGAGWQERYEIRIGLVMFGGVALAVYMNGVVRELLHLVRAAQRGDLANAYGPLLKAARASVMIDVIAGTSAGGLNGLVLAKALATGSDAITGLSKLWKTEAQFDKLVQSSDPQALLSGEIMERRLQEVMEGMTKSANETLAAKVPVLDLFITATDLAGREVVYRDLRAQSVAQTRNQHLFHLRKRTVLEGRPDVPDPTGRVAIRGYNWNDFTEQEPGVAAARDRLLTMIGRATSAFPGALPPQRIRRSDAEAAHLPSVLPDGERSEFWFSDGGILMNKPFKPVVQTIFHRSASRPVERALLFLDPDPPAPGTEDRQRREGEPHFLEVATAPFSLPMNEDIVGYLEEVDRQNAFRGQVQEVFRAMEERLGAAPVSEEGPAFASYVSMRAAALRVELAANFRQAFRGEVRGNAAVDALVEELGKRSLLPHWDHPYHTRRLHYLLLRLDGLAGSAPSDEAVEESRRRVLGAVRQQLWHALEDWRNAWWVVANALTQTCDKVLRARFEAVAKAAYPELEAPAAVDAVAELFEWTAERAAEAETQAYALLVSPPATEAWRGDQALAERMRGVSQGFPARDVVLFPLSRFGPLTEWDQVNVMRLAPGPTSHIPRPARGRLASETIGHFGGFFDQRWRENDILWGRLDATEQICDLVRKQAAPHLTAAEQAELDGAIEACVECRHREILLEEAEILDLAKLRARYDELVGERKPEAELLLTLLKQVPVRDAAAAREELIGRLERDVRRAPPPPLPDLPPEPLKRVILELAPKELLWAYLTHDHNVGEEKLPQGGLGLLTAGSLPALQNLVAALGRNPARLQGTMLGWVNRVLLAVLRPLTLLLGVLLPWRGPIARHAWQALVLGLALAALDFSGAVTLHGWGWSATGVLLGVGALWLLISKLAHRLVAVALAGAAAVGLGFLLTRSALLTWTPLAFVGDLVTPVGWTLAGVTTLAGAVMLWLGRLPHTPEAPRQMIDLEVAASAEEASRILQAWQREDAQAPLRAAFQIGADYLFILGYALLLALLTGLGGGVLGRYWAPLGAAGAVVAWGQLVAGALDMIENVGLMQTLLGAQGRQWTWIARWAARGKFLLIGLAVPFVLAWLVDWVLTLR